MKHRAHGIFGISGTVRTGIAALLLVCSICPAQQGGEGEATLRLKFNDATLEIVLDDYSAITGKTLLMSPNLPKITVTLRSQGELTIPDYLEAVETVLAMHGVALLDAGDKFVKVVPVKEAREETTEIRESPERAPLAETAGLISQMIPLRYVDIKEAEAAVKALKHEYAQVHLFERTNSILVTDTPSNINRIMQIIAYIDQPVEIREEPNVIQIRYAKAADIKAKLEEIVAESQEEGAEKSTVPRQREAGPPGAQTATPPGVIRARRAQEKEAEPEVLAELVELAERGIIRGRVKIIADDRTNVLIIITRPENMAFFEKIINVLDVETAPDVIVRVFRLEFSEAKTVAEMLNELIGATSKDDEVTTAAAKGEGEARSAALNEYVRQLRAEAAASRKSKVGELSKENIKILSDDRTNSLIIMASRADVETLSEIVRDMDMMLSQVLIEAVIIEVTLDDEISTGVDWVQHSMLAYSQKSTKRTPIMAFTGGGGGGLLNPQSAMGSPSFQDTEGNPMHGLTYYLTLFGLNMDFVVRAASTDSRAKVLQSPVVLTTDNTEATITSTERIYVFKGVRYDEQGNPYDDFDTESVGLTLKVKPQINKNKIVMMTISQTVSEPGTPGPPESGRTVSSERTVEASIAVADKETIILGGLVRNQTAKARGKIPILGDIPILGRLFSHVSDSKGKNEIVVFITPYVIDTPDRIATETARRKESLHIEGLWKSGWSDSKLAEPTDESMMEETGTQGSREEAPGGAASNEEDASSTQKNSAAWSDLDPELVDFIRQQDEKWGKTLKEADKRIDAEVKKEE